MADWFYQNPYRKKQKKPKDLKDAKYNADIIRMSSTYNGEISPFGLTSIFNEPISLKTKKLEFIFPAPNFLNNLRTITLRYRTSGLDLYSDYEIEGDYDNYSILNKPIGTEEITIMEESIDSSMFDLINEFIGCYKNKYYLASCCLAREMIYEIAKMFDVKIMKNEKYAFGFRKTLENIEEKVPLIQKDHDFWITLIESAGNVVHYKHTNSNAIADIATQGIIKIFNYISVRRFIK